MTGYSDWTYRLVEEVLPAFGGTAQTLLWHVAIPSLDLQSLFMGDDASIVFVFVIESKFRASWNRVDGEESKVVDILIRMVI